jgi:hypothetical protein
MFWSGFSFRTTKPRSVFSTQQWSGLLDFSDVTKPEILSPMRVQAMRQGVFKKNDIPVKLIEGIAKFRASEVVEHQKAARAAAKKR